MGKKSCKKIWDYFTNDFSRQADAMFYMVQTRTYKR